MLKRFGASSKHRKAAGALKSPTIVVAGQPETNEEEPASIIEHNKVTFVCEGSVRCAGFPLGRGCRVEMMDCS